MEKDNKKHDAHMHHSGEQHNHKEETKQHKHNNHPDEKKVQEHAHHQELKTHSETGSSTKQKMMHPHHTASDKIKAQTHKEHSEGHAHHIDDFKKRFYVSLILTIPILLLSPMIQEFLGLQDKLRFAGDSIILFLLSTVVYVYGGYPFLKGFVDDIKKMKPGMMTLIALAITVAYVYSSVVFFGLMGMAFFWEIATLIDIMLLGHWIEMKSVLGASRALEELARLLPSEAHKVQDDGSIIDIPLEEVSKGDKILIKPGEKIPADGKVLDGKSSVNESMLTGESKPVKKEKESEVIGGSLNGEGSLTIEINRTGEESFLSQVIELVNQAQQSKSKTQNLADRAAFWLTLLAIFAGAVTFFFWNFFSTFDIAFALERTVTVMVITCPHALGLAIPLVVSVSTGLAARNGFLIRNRTAFENSRNITAIIFDKTGTLTEGNFEVTNVIPKNGFTEKEILFYAASVESNSQHPIAQGIIRASKDKLSVQGFNSLPGKGIEGKVKSEKDKDWRKVMVVSPAYMKEKNIDLDGKTNTLQEQGKTVVHILIDDKYAGAIALGDKIKSDSYTAISKLKEMGIKTILLTGDNKQTADYVSSELKMDESIAEVLPDQKSAKVKEVQSQGYIVAMTGDGVNDAPALAQADIGIAIGAGSDVAVETADIVLIKNNPNDVAAILALSRSTYRKMIQNLWWATGYNIFAIPLAAGVFYSVGIILSPALGAVLMSVSTVIVAINARLLKL